METLHCSSWHYSRSNILYCTLYVSVWIYYRFFLVFRLVDLCWHTFRRKYAPLTCSVFKGNNNATIPSSRNQLAPMGHGWVSVPNSSCNSWRWSEGMVGGPFGCTLGGAGWLVEYNEEQRNTGCACWLCSCESWCASPAFLASGGGGAHSSRALLYLPLILACTGSTLLQNQAKSAFHR